MYLWLLVLFLQIQLEKSVLKWSTEINQEFQNHQPWSQTLRVDKGLRLSGLQHEVEYCTHTWLQQVEQAPYGLHEQVEHCVSSLRQGKSRQQSLSKIWEPKGAEGVTINSHVRVRLAFMRKNSGVVAFPLITIRKATFPVVFRSFCTPLPRLTPKGSLWALWVVDTCKLPLCGWNLGITVSSRSRSEWKVWTS